MLSSALYRILRRLVQGLVAFSFIAYYAVDVTHLHSSPGLPLEVETRWKATYATSGNRLLYRKPMVNDLRTPDVTAVILNWSRLPNVVQIAKIMCHSLRDILVEVSIWNNNPRPLTSEDFAEANCPHDMLKIHNSHENVFFRARFLACARANTRYCFIQDDDYFIRPAIIRAMRTRMADIPKTSLHLLPPHEMLYSQLSTIQVGSIVRTLFAWLGYGTMMERLQAQCFLDLLRATNATEDVFKMADNYYTILSNKIPELWFDQNHELGGGTPFTVGPLGEERNNKHIMNAGATLDSLTRVFAQDPTIKYPYVSLPTPAEPEMTVSRAVCFDDPCVLETNIRLLPDMRESTASASEVITHTARRFKALGVEAAERYLQFSPSFAVDGDPTTKFQSLGDASEGEWISLDWPTADFGGNNIEMTLLVDQPTEVIFRNCQFAMSADGKSWITQTSNPKCSAAEGTGLWECSFAIDRYPFKKIRIVSGASVPHRWAIYEMWLRQRLRT